MNTLKILNLFFIIGSLFIEDSFSAHRHRKFTPDEDNALIQAVNKYTSKHNGTYNWIQIVISSRLERNAKQCYERYLNYLRPDINHDPFSDEEIVRLRDAIKLYGPHYSEIQKSYFPNRTQNQIKNQYHKMKRRGFMDITNETPKHNDEDTNFDPYSVLVTMDDNTLWNNETSHIVSPWYKNPLEPLDI